MATANEVMGVLKKASDTLTENYINHIDHLTGDFWHIEVSTVGFNQYDVVCLENLLLGLFELEDISVHYTGHYFALAWFSRAKSDGVYSK